MEASSDDTVVGGPAAAGSEGDAGVGLLREGIDAYNRGDLGWVFDHASDRIEVRTVEGLVNSGGFAGKDRFRLWMSEWQEAWSEMTIEIINVDAIDERFLVAEVRQRGTGALSGIETTMELVQVLEIRAGEIARFHLYPDIGQAMIGLEPLRASG